MFRVPRIIRIFRVLNLVRVAPWANGARPICSEWVFLSCLDFALACNPGAITFAQYWTIQEWDATHTLAATLNLDGERYNLNTQI